MPSYDFVCQECRTAFEVRLSMSSYSAGEGRTCPECGSSRVDRAFTTVNVIAGSRSRSGGLTGGGSCGSGGFT
jgi:putative FmdB family regulatory protein